MIYGIYRHGSAKYVLEFGISKIFLWSLVSAAKDWSSQSFLVRDWSLT